MIEFKECATGPPLVLGDCQNETLIESGNVPNVRILADQLLQLRMKDSIYMLTCMSAELFITP